MASRSLSGASLLVAWRAKARGSSFGVDAAAVVDDADEGDAALVGLDRDARGAGVEGVLDQLLDDGGRALDHLARGDAAGDFRREHSNRHADAILAVVRGEEAD